MLTPRPVIPVAKVFGDGDALRAPSDLIYVRGWSVIHRSDLIAVCVLLISVRSFALAIFGSIHHQ
jgi:hypothetical protein